MKRISIVLFVTFLIFPRFVLADLGPKPSMDFTFSNLPSDIKIISGQQLECEDKYCVKNKLLGDAGPQGFGCGNLSDGGSYCGSLAYGYANYHKLVIKFSDKTRESNIFAAKAFDSKFEVTLNDNGNLLVSEIASNSKDNPIVLENKPTSEVGQLIEYKHNQDETFPIENFLLAFFITIIIEIFVAAIYFLIKKISLFSLRWIFYANFITVPLFWFLAYKYNFSITPYFIGELIIVLFEAVFIKTFIKQLRWQDALILSIAMNIASYFIGNILIFVLGAQFWQ